MNREIKNGSVAIMFTILGYVFVNVAIIETGRAMLNFGLMNIVACSVTFLIFRKEVKSLPDWKFSVLGAIGVWAIQFGVRWTHAALNDPSNTMSVVYDIVVFSSIGFWAMVEGPLGLPQTRVKRFDIVLHAVMFGLVVTRLWLHWADGWSIGTFLPTLLAVFGYWLYNISIRMAQTRPESARATNIGMNALAGISLIGFTLIVGGTSISANWAMFLGGFSIVTIVFSLGQAYKFFGPIGWASLVVTATYDGLMVTAPLVMSIIYRQSFGIADMLITFGFIIIMIIRVVLYQRDHRATS